MATLVWRIVAAYSFRLILLLPIYFLSSCAIVIFCVILTPSAHSSVHAASSLPRLFLLGAYLVVTWVFLRGIFSIFFRAAIDCSIFVSICPSHIFAAVFAFSCSGSFSFWLRFSLDCLAAVLSLSLSHPSSVSAHLLRCFWLLLLFLSPLWFSAHLLLFPPLFSCPQFTIRCRCCVGRSPLLVACLPSPVVWGAVPCAYFLLLLLFFACSFLGGGCYYVQFPHSLGFFSLSLVLPPLGSSLDFAYLTFSLARSPSFLGLSLPSSDILAGVAPSLRLGGRLLWLRY